MSQAALLIAVVDKLRKTCGYSARECDLMYDGRPAPDCGDFFVAVHPGSWRPDLHEDSWDEYFDVAVTITYRVSHIVPDKRGHAWAKPLQGLEARCREVIPKIHQQTDIMEAANRGITGEAYKIIEPLRFKGGPIPPPQPADAAWFSAQGDTVAGLIAELMFVDAHRIQSLDERMS